MIFTRYALYRDMGNQRLTMITLTHCAGLALISGAIGPHVWLKFYESAIGRYPESKVVALDIRGSSAAGFVGDFKFLPTFLLFGLLGQAASQLPSSRSFC